MFGSLRPLSSRRVGQIGGGVIEELDHLAEIDHRIGDALVLAELMVGGVQVTKLMP